VQPAGDAAARGVQLAEGDLAVLGDDRLLVGFFLNGLMQQIDDSHVVSPF